MDERTPINPMQPTRANARVADLYRWSRQRVDKYIHNILFVALIATGGCAIHPRSYSTGNLSGRVVDGDSSLPISNALVIAEVWITDRDAMNGQYGSKRVDSGYGITDSEGRFTIPSLSTTYMYFAFVTRQRTASGGAVRVYHPDYEATGRTKHVNGTVEWMMQRKENTRGLNQIREHFEGSHSIAIRDTDRDVFRSIIQALYQHDSRPNENEKKLYKRLMQ
jgi:hypothetical protein